MIFRRWPLE
ncbi:Protein of unknown function [Lactobacillus delbrueckii subsp. lactis]|nr:Putative uncharacterized protein [Lactobacillus delbrueckii subsp. lactis]CDR80838.1 Protein of unknown function [Lactobacillus delbrueckii subsp. lactis]